MASETDVPKTETAKKYPQRAFRKLQQEVKHLFAGILLVLVVSIFDSLFQEKDMTTTSGKNTLRWTIACLLALFLLGWANKYLNAQEVKQVPVFYAQLGEGMRGQTVCDKAGNIAILISPALNQDTATLTTTIEHEMVHVGQIRPIGCEAAGIRYRTHALEIETEAYCKELKAKMKTENAVEILTTFVVHIRAHYAPASTLDQVTDLVYKHCLGRRANDPP